MKNKKINENKEKEIIKKRKKSCNSNKIASCRKIQFVKIGKKSVCRLTGLQRSGWCLPKTGRSLGQVVWMYTSSLSLSPLFLHLFLNESLHSWYVLFFFFRKTYMHVCIHNIMYVYICTLFVSCLLYIENFQFCVLHAEIVAININCNFGWE